MYTTTALMISEVDYGNFEKVEHFCADSKLTEKLNIKLLNRPTNKLAEDSWFDVENQLEKLKAQSLLFLQVVVFYANNPNNYHNIASILTFKIMLLGNAS